MSSEDLDAGWEEETSAEPMALQPGSGISNAGEPPFEIRGFSLGNAVLLTGILITIGSFADYFSSSSSGGDGFAISGLSIIYALPITLAGCALKYTEIEPVKSIVGPGAEGLFDRKATEVMRKIKQDVTRHRYGDDAHLDSTVKRLGLLMPMSAYPQLIELREEVEEDGELGFSMVWQSLETPYKMWADEKRVKKYETFFGPDIRAECVKVDAEKRLVAIKLVTKGAEAAVGA